jgi:hypothetical protein
MITAASKFSGITEKKEENQEKEEKQKIELIQMN